MRGLRRERGGVRLGEGARPTVGAGDVRLEVVCVGVCRTDVYVAEGRIPVDEPRVLGHEVCGVVRESRAEAWSPGEAVCVMPALERDVFLGVDRDGAFAEELVVPGRALHRARGLSMRHAAYAEPMAASMAVLGIGLPANGRGRILGGGRIATLTRRVLAQAGFSDVGALDEGDADLDFVIETRATAETLTRAIAALRPGGTLVLKSRPYAPVPFDVAAAVQREIRIATARYAPMDDAIARLEERPSLVDDLLGPVLPLAEFDRAFGSREDVKAFLTPASAAEEIWARALEGAG